MREAWHVACMGGEKRLQILCGKPEGDRPLESIGACGGILQQIGCESVNSIDLCQDRVQFLTG
jgi:hypothetical protein